jgi:hypothetical protein
MQIKTALDGRHNTRHNNTWQNDNQHSVSQQSNMTFSKNKPWHFSITILNIQCCFVEYYIFISMMDVIMLNIIMKSVIMQNVIIPGVAALMNVLSCMAELLWPVL